MRTKFVFILMIAPLICWGQSYNEIPNCSGQTEIAGAACFVSDDILVTSYALTEFSDEGSIKIVTTQKGKEVSYNAKVINSNEQKGWSILKIEDPDYHNKVSIKYGITRTPLKTVFYLNEDGGVSVGKLYDEGHNFSIQQSVTRDDFDSPLIGSPVFDNSGHLIAIVSESGTGTSAMAIDILTLKSALSSLGITLVDKDIDDNPSTIRKDMQPCMAIVLLNVSGSSYFKDYCSYYSEALSEIESKDYEKALRLLSMASQSKRKPQNNDIEAQVSICKYWIFRNKGDEYARQYQIDLAKQQYDAAYAQKVPWSLGSEITAKKDELQVFPKSVESGDSYYANGNYELAYEMYKKAKNATIKPKNGSYDMISLDSKLKRSKRKYINGQKDQMIMVNVAPEWSYGLTYGIAPKKVGWYLNLMTGTDFSGLGTTYSCDADGLVDGHIVAYSGNKSNVRIFGQTGLFFRTGKVLSFKFGVGCGIDNYYLETREGEWVLENESSYNGIQYNGGLMLWLGSWSISLDMNIYGSSVNKLNYEPLLGIGFRF